MRRILTARATTVRATATAAAVLALVLAAAGCGDDDGDEASSPATAAPSACPGQPIRLTAIASLTGPVAVDAGDVKDGLRVALGAINGECQLGRPLEITLCDDQSNPNESLACGRRAASDGSLALFDSLSSLPDGPSVAGLPSVLNLGITTYDLTSPTSYPASAGPVTILAEVGAAKAAGASRVLFVAPDTAYTQVTSSMATTLGDQLGLEVDSLFFPADTSDFTTVAAQVADRDPEAIILLTPATLPFFNALATTGVSPADVPVITLASFVPPDVVNQLGDKIEGTYLVGQIVPPTETENAGIEQMRKEYRQAGLDPDDPRMSVYAVDVWSNAHILADALAALEPAELRTLNGDGIVSALVAAAPIDFPTRSRFDFNNPALPEIESLAPFRIFTREAIILRVDDGKVRSVTDFIDVTTEFDL
jgi:branched-chain amino acid transport system substrate-binding protein